MWFLGPSGTRDPAERGPNGPGGLGCGPVLFPGTKGRGAPEASTWGFRGTAEVNFAPSSLVRSPLTQDFRDPTWWERERQQGENPGADAAPPSSVGSSKTRTPAPTGPPESHTAHPLGFRARGGGPDLRREAEDGGYPRGLEVRDPT